MVRQPSEEGSSTSTSGWGVSMVVGLVRGAGGHPILEAKDKSHASLFPAVETPEPLAGEWRGGGAGEGKGSI